MKKVAIIGTQGVPAKYGGFETLVENLIGEYCSTEVAYTVFCSSKDFEKQQERYKNARLRYVPLHANGVQSIAYDIWSLIKAVRGYDVIVVLGTSGCSFLPFFRLFCRKRLIVNIDGLEHRRAKWGGWAKRFLRFSEQMAVRCADVIIVDNRGIELYVAECYHRPSTLIAYGGDHVLRNSLSTERELDILNKYGLQPSGYGISICRIEPENHCHLILETVARGDLPFVFIGNWSRSDYSRQLNKRYEGCEHILFIESLYDLKPLHALRNNCKYYVHGHSAGGTNPSLVEMMFFGRPIFAFDCIYNRETTEREALFFKDRTELTQLLEMTDERLGVTGDKMALIANKRYRWEEIVKQYEDLY